MAPTPRSTPAPARRPGPLRAGWALLLPTVLFLVGCGEPGSETPEEDAPTTWSLVEELRIGSNDPGPELFGQLAALAVDDEGRILVLDQQASEVRVFDADGTHEATLGGPGEGPGELLRPFGLAVHPTDGTTWVVASNRYTVFDADGGFDATHPRPFSYFAVPWPGGFGADGRLGDVASPTDFVRLDDALAPADTVAIPTVEVEQVRVVREDGAGLMSLNRPFASRLHWQVDGAGRLWTAESGRMHFVATDPSGDTVEVRSREHTPVPVSPAEAEEAVAGAESTIRGFGTDVRVEGELRPASTKPAFQSFLVDDDGRLWVEPNVAEDAAPALELWTAGGDWAGRIERPAGLQLSYPRPVVRGPHLWAVVTDELDVPHVVRYRIEGLP